MVKKIKIFILIMYIWLSLFEKLNLNIFKNKNRKLYILNGNLKIKNVYIKMILVFINSYRLLLILLYYKLGYII